MSRRDQVLEAFQKLLHGCDVVVERANYDTDQVRVTVRLPGGSAEVSDVLDPLEALSGGAAEMAMDLYRRLREAELA